MDSQFNKKVYINPNYKAGQNKTHQQIYINQNFREPITQTNSINKIFVNPNFIKNNNVSNLTLCAEKQHSTVKHLLSLNLDPKYNSQHFQEAHCYYKNQIANGTQQQNINVHSHNNTFYNPQSSIQATDNLPSTPNSLPLKYDITHNITKNNIITKSRYNLVRKPSQKTVNSPKIIQPCGSQHIASNLLPISKSRYTLIRHKENKMPAQSPLLKKRNLRVSKYSIINIDSIKSKMGTEDILPKSPNFSSSKLVYNNGFKLKRHLSYTLKTNGTEKRVNNHTRKIRVRAVIENIKGKSKIINIPCALFCKYGKCLRNINSKCPYVHDKKLVSLCRKFLKGLCHNADCTLSHDISKTKMPTCYFYLKGICVKDNCPYLHVKLSDQALICQDFLKGYCERGENCLFRHMKTKTSNNKKNITRRKTMPSVNKTSTLSDKSSTNNAENASLEDRYFKDKDITDEDQKNCDNIKPTRCKLGDLPSYIKL